MEYRTSSSTPAEPSDILQFVRRIFTIPLFILLAVCVGRADDVSFQPVKVPDAKGKPVTAVLTFSDTDKAVEVRPEKGDRVKIPYSEIDSFSYEYTRKHRVNEGTIAAAAVGVGAVAMLTKSRSHWLIVHYTDQDIRHSYIIRMDKHNYLHILEAVRDHTGKDAEVLGNADKRR